MKWLRLLALPVLAAVSGCYAYVPPPPAVRVYAPRRGCVWVPPHHQPFRGWVPGHWRC